MDDKSSRISGLSCLWLVNDKHSFLSSQRSLVTTNVYHVVHDIYI